MSPIKSSLSSENVRWIFCCYINTTSILQIIRITNIPNWYFERVVFPEMRLLFEAPHLAKLEVHTAEAPSAILADKIPCGSLLLLPYYPNQTDGTPDPNNR